MAVSWSESLLSESIARKEQVFSLEENLRPEKAVGTKIIIH